MGSVAVFLDLVPAFVQATSREQCYLTHRAARKSSAVYMGSSFKTVFKQRFGVSCRETYLDLCRSQQ